MLIAIAVGLAASLTIAVACSAMRPSDGRPNAMLRDDFHRNLRGLFPSHRRTLATGTAFVDASAGWTHTEYHLNPTWTRYPDAPWERLLSSYPVADRVSPRTAALFRYPATRALPSWVGVPMASGMEETVITSAWGWPARCLYGVERESLVPWGSPRPRRVEVLEGYWVVGSDSPAARVRRIPYFVIPGGLALNTFLLGSLWLGTSLLAGCAGRAWRRARGQRGPCRWCAYTLEGLPPGTPCPECGRDNRCDKEQEPARA